MRLLTLLAFVLPIPALADTLTLTSRVTDVTLYPDSAAMIRRAPFEVPAGRHDLILRDLPMVEDIRTLRVRVDGVETGAITWREDYVPPSGLPENPEVQAAREAVKAVERKIEAVHDDMRRARLKGDAAKVRLAFLGRLGSSEMSEMSADQLAALSDRIATDALTAHRTIQEAEIATREAGRALEQLEKDLDAARKALAAVALEDEDRIYLSVEVLTDAPTQGEVVLSYLSDYASGWEPVYDVQLARGDTPSATVHRGALIRQETGENWDGVSLTLSTLRPSGQLWPQEVYPLLRRIVDPVSSKQRAGADRMEAPPMAAPVVEEAGSRFSVSHDGPGVTYLYPDPVSLASGADVTRLRLGALTLPADLQAVAVPSADETAFLRAELTNDTGEVILASDTALLHVDGHFVGSTAMPLVPAGGTAKLGFGPIEELRLASVPLERGEGETGILSSYSELRRHVRLEIENLSDQSWDVWVLDRVPYSEQDALEIDWETRPAPDEVDVENRRGVLGWSLTVPPNATETIELRTRLTWPEGKILR